MLAMQSLDELRRAIASCRGELFGRFPIKSLAVFGSFARGDQTPDSDIDLLVEFDQPVGIEFIDLADRLEALLNRRVDLVSRRGIKPKYLDRIKPELEYV